MKTISLKEIQQLEQKVNTILRPLIMRQISEFVRVYIDKEDKMYPKALQMIAIEVASIGRDLHEKDLI